MFVTLMAVQHIWLQAAQLFYFFFSPQIPNIHLEGTIWQFDKCKRSEGLAPAL